MEKTNVTFNSCRDFSVEKFITPTLLTLKELSANSSNSVFHREAIFTSIKKYISMSKSAENRKHTNVGDPLWHHFVDLAMSAIRDAGMLYDYSFRRGMYFNFTNDTIDYLNAESNQVVTDLIYKNFLSDTKVNIVKVWKKFNNKSKVVLIKKAK